MISYNSQTMCEKFSNRVLFYIKKFENSLKLPGVLFSISLIIYITVSLYQKLYPVSLQYSWSLYTQTLKTAQV